MSYKHSYINPFTDLLLLEFNKLSISIFWISLNNSLIVVVFFYILPISQDTGANLYKLVFNIFN